jgi:hypothetical protein
MTVKRRPKKAKGKPEPKPNVSKTERTEPRAEPTKTEPTKSEALALQVVTFKTEVKEQSELFHTDNKDTFSSVEIDDHLETWPIKSKRFGRLLRYLWYKKYHVSLPKELLTDFIEQWDAEAEFDGPERPVALRVGSTNSNEVFIDLCNDDWEVVHITPSGWRVRRNAPVKFIRAQGMLPLPRPVRDENALRNLDNLLTNLDADGRVLYKCFLLGCLNPSGKYPVLVVTGEQGSTKSTVCRVIRALIDPSQAPLTTMPSPDDLLLAASKSWLQAFDNVSRVSQEMSDALCRLATGGGRRTRLIYTPDNEMIFNAVRPILVNSIVDGVVTAPDLADRSLGIHTRGALANYKDEKTFWQEFDTMKAGIFGLLCDAVHGNVGGVPPGGILPCCCATAESDSANATTTTT